MRSTQLRHSVWLTATALAALSPTASVHAETYEVTLEGTSFQYEGMENLDIDLTINLGDTIQWLWVQGRHNVVSGFPDDPNTGELFFSGAPTSDPGTVFEFTFTDPGVYGYFCEPHAAAGMISSVTVMPEPILSGDYNGSDTIDAADYTAWLAALGGTVLLNDPTPGAVDQSDYAFWKSHFGETVGSGAVSNASVPEPNAWIFFGFGGILFLRRSHCATKGAASF